MSIKNFLDALMTCRNNIGILIIRREAANARAGIRCCCIHKLGIYSLRYGSRMQTRYSNYRRYFKCDKKKIRPFSTEKI